MSDLIDRQQAINVIERMRAYIGHNMERAVGAAFIEILDDVGKDIGRLPSAQFATDTNVGTKLGTNLAEVGTDLISRQVTIDAITDELDKIDHVPQWVFDRLEKRIRQLPSAQPEIVRCKDCKHWMPYEWMFSEVWQSKNMADYPEDEMGCNWCDMAMKSNDFCSRAERRTE